MADRACHDCHALISAFIDGEATRDEQERIRQHLAACPDCQATLDSYRTIGGEIRTLPAIHPPNHLTESIYAHTIDAEPRRLFLITSRLGYSLAAVASVLLIFVVAAYLIVGGYERGVAPKVSSSEPTQNQVWPPQLPIEIKFNKDMNRESVIAAMGILPASEQDRLSLTWDGNTLIIGRDTPLKAGTTYGIKISTDATDKWGNHLAQPFDLSFAASSSLTTVQTPTPQPTPSATEDATQPMRPSATSEPAIASTPTVVSENAATPTATGTDRPAPGTGNSTEVVPSEPIAPVNPTETPTPRPTLTPTPTEEPHDVDPTSTATASPTATVTPVPPTATSTATPTTTPTPTVAVTPTPESIPVVGAIGDVYWGDQTVQDRLGAPRAAAYPFDTQQLDFQRGVMLVDESGASIYVLKAGAGWDTFQFPAEPVDGYPLAVPQPEGDIFSPGGFFGELWQSDPSVGDDIGFALSEDPIGFTATIQKFEYGLMIETQKTIYVIYNDFTWDWFTY